MWPISPIRCIQVVQWHNYGAAWLTNMIRDQGQWEPTEAPASDLKFRRYIFL
jgi:hypothetical protein